MASRISRVGFGLAVVTAFVCGLLFASGLDLTRFGFAQEVRIVDPEMADEVEVVLVHLPAEEGDSERDHAAQRPGHLPRPARLDEGERAGVDEAAGEQEAKVDAADPDLRALAAGGFDGAVERFPGLANGLMTRGGELVSQPVKEAFGL